MSTISSDTSIFLGVFRLFVSDKPSCPFSLLPKLHTVPSERNVIVNPLPFTTFAAISTSSSFTTFIQIFLFCPSSDVATKFTLPILFPVILKFGTKS